MNLEGIFPPIATPFKDDAIDLDGMKSNVTKWMTTGLAGVLVLGSNGEAPLLDADESFRVASAARECVPSGKTLIVGAGEESTRSTIAAVKRAAQAGADVVLVRTPCYFKKQMTTDLFVRHFTAVADASPVPVLPYNVPGLTGVSMAAEAVARLATHANIPGVKDSSADLTQIADLVAMTPPGFKVLVGSAPTLYASLCVGAIGGIVAAACVIPDLMVELYRLARAGKHAEALALQRRITPLGKSVTTMFGVAGLKAAMDLAGYVGGVPRQPLPAATPQMIDTLRGQFAELGVGLASRT
ncbi:MAG TPA: dihydrodipicolinate synthase family protein [Vicinamibacterales bacterium]|jgi:4-hydroxy-2-oxoglutarate aldolase